MTKLGNNENVTMEVMAKICNTLDCKIDYEVEILPDENNENPFKERLKYGKVYWIRSPE